MGQHSIKKPLERVVRNGACLMTDSKQFVKETAQIVDDGISNTVQNVKLEVADLSERTQKKIEETTPKIKELVVREIKESRQTAKQLYDQSKNVLNNPNYVRTGRAVVVGIFVVNGLMQTTINKTYQNISPNHQDVPFQFNNFQLTAYKNNEVSLNSLGFVRQVVQYGQTVWTLGQQDGFSVSQWSQVNPEINPNTIIAGQSYNIPTPTLNTSSNEVPSTQSTSSETTPQSNTSTVSNSNKTNQSKGISLRNQLIPQPIISSSLVPETSNSKNTSSSNHHSSNTPSLINQTRLSLPITNLNPTLINPNYSSIPSSKIDNSNNALEGPVTMQDVITYFQQNSTLSNTVIAGIVGNLNYESSLNTERYENTFPVNTLTPANSLTPSKLNSSSMGWGLAQWTPSEKIIGWSQNQHLNPNLMATQLQYIIDNIQNSPALYEKLMSANNASSAAYIFMEYYEMPANYSSASFREAYASQAFSLMQQ